MIIICCWKISSMYRLFGSNGSEVLFIILCLLETKVH